MHKVNTQKRKLLNASLKVLIEYYGEKMVNKTKFLVYAVSFYVWLYVFRSGQYIKTSKKPIDVLV